jgi:hypothetical protein
LKFAAGGPTCAVRASAVRSPLTEETERRKGIATDLVAEAQMTWDKIIATLRAHGTAVVVMAPVDQPLHDVDEDPPITRLEKRTHLHGKRSVERTPVGGRPDHRRSDKIYRESREAFQTRVGPVKEMRKYRVGWQFITQTVSEIQKDIFRSLHYRVYGVGLGVGSEEQHIKDMEEKEAFQMYSTLPDPRLSKIFSFMVCGNLIALGTTGNPMYIEGFGSDSDVMERNGLKAEFDDYKASAAPAAGDDGPPAAKKTYLPGE